MKKISLRRIHKYSGLISVLVLLILSITGVLLNHKNWDFLYSIEVTNKVLPKSLENSNKRLIQSYTVFKDNILVASKEGIFIKEKNTSFFQKPFSIQTLSLRHDKKNDILYAATSNGIYISKDGKVWTQKYLANEYINAIALYGNMILASIDKRELILLDTKGNIINKLEVNIPAELLKEDITLARFVRDLHYGRGLFDGDISLFINDFSTLWLIFLCITGFLIWMYIKKIKEVNANKKLKTVLKLHINSLFLFALIPLILLLITGIFLDHGKFFRPFLKNTIVSNDYLPPVYKTLRADIWSVDLYEDGIRIGNRYGIYQSTDMKNWKLENKGFAYVLKRIDEKLFVSGMGSANRILENSKYQIAKNTPHMYKDVNIINKEIVYFSARKTNVSLPLSNKSTLYSIMLSLHDGKFFSTWWVFVNDIASVLLLVLLVTGTIRWYKKKKVNFKRRIN